MADIEVDHSNVDAVSGSSSVMRAGNTAKEVIRRYMKKVKPLYEKLSQNKQKMTSAETGIEKLPSSSSSNSSTGNRESITTSINGIFSNFSRVISKGEAHALPAVRLRCAAHRTIPGFSPGPGTVAVMTSATVDRSSMEELQSAIQGAIAHCKNSQNNKTMFSNEI